MPVPICYARFFAASAAGDKALDTQLQCRASVGTILDPFDRTPSLACRDPRGEVAERLNAGFENQRAARHRGSNPPLRHSSSEVATREALFVCLLLVLATAACHGPSLCVNTDGDCYVDGCAESRTELPFRYYGTRTIDVLPNRTLAPTDFARQPARQAVPVEPPVSQWLFPLDFLGEVVIRTFGQHRNNP